MITPTGQWIPDYPGQQSWQDPAYMRAWQQQNHMVQPQQAAAQPTMTPPTIHAELVMVDSEAAAGDYPVAVGASQMMMRKDEAAIYVKTAMQNGQYQLDVFEKRPPAPPAPKLDPADVVTKDYLEQRLADLLAPAKAAPEKEAAA